MAFFGKYYFSCTTHGREPETVGELLRLRNDAGESWRPAADIYETEGGLVVLMELAGVSAAELLLQVSPGALVVSGRRTDSCPHGKKRYCQMEIYHGAFERLLPLPLPVDGGGARAIFRNGMLEVFLPLADAAEHGGDVMRIRLECDGE